MLYDNDQNDYVHVYLRKIFFSPPVILFQTFCKKSVVITLGFILLGCIIGCKHSNYDFHKIALVCFTKVYMVF